MLMLAMVEMKRRLVDMKAVFTQFCDKA